MEKWIPWAKRPDYEMKTAGAYAKGHPIGAIVHFTAGATESDGGLNSLKYGKDMGYAFLVITRDGTLWQAHPMDRWGHHAGASEWEGIEGQVSDDLVGIEICSAGRLTAIEGRYYPWFGLNDSGEPKSTQYAISEENVRIDGRGVWHKYTAAQEETLKKLLVWLARNDPAFKPAFVLGHDEVAPRRKNDPGGCLSMGMIGLRQWLIAELAKTQPPAEPEKKGYAELKVFDGNGKTVFTGKIQST